VQPAALITKANGTNANGHLALPKPAFELSQKTLDPKTPVAKKPAAKAKAKPARVRQAKRATQKPTLHQKQPVLSAATAPKPAPPAAVNVTSGKPSPGIAKQ
jgi:hypothetical protein